MYRLIDHKQNILRPKGDQSFHTVCAICRLSGAIISEVKIYLVRVAGLGLGFIMDVI